MANYENVTSDIGIIFFGWNKLIINIFVKLSELFGSGLSLPITNYLNKSRVTTKSTVAFSASYATRFWVKHSFPHPPTPIPFIQVKQATG